MGRVDPLYAAQEAARCAQDGNLKLAKAVDVMRAALETIISAEWDHEAGRAVSPQDLRNIALSAMNEYSGLTGQNWRRAKLIGSYAGDRNLNFEE